MEQKYIANLGHELQLGDRVEFIVKKHHLIGKIIEFKNGKCVIETRACRYTDEEELAEIRRIAKRKYTIVPNRCYLLVA